MDKDIVNYTLREYLIPLNVDAIFKEIRDLQLDKYVKKLNTLKLTELMVYAQLKKLGSLAAITLELEAEKPLQEILRLESISASQLSRKLREIPAEVMESICEQCITKVRKHCGNRVANEKLGMINLIDSSTVSMCLMGYTWANFRKTKAGVKLHLRLVYKDEQVYPDKSVMTNAKKADRSQMDELVVIEPHALNVFDRGYLDYRKFDEYCDPNKPTRFVTRLKENAVINEVLEEKAVQSNSPVIRDVIVRLGRKPGYVMKHALRLIETQDSEGNPVIILTNDFDLNADEIGAIYRKRWQIEIFFKWLKQHFVLKHLYGKSENAVYNQIRIALITYCLLLLIKRKSGFHGELFEIYKRLNVYWNKPFSEFMKSLHRTPTRTSTGRRRLKNERIFEETKQQYASGEIEHLDWLNYDPINL